MCLGMNPDILAPGERCASTSNRNFEGRQGRGGRTHLLSPAMAAAAAVTGRLTDVRELVAMKPVTRRSRGPVAALDRANVDTDQIIPKQFLKRIERTGFGEFLFWDWAKQPDFPLNRPEFQGAPILAAGRNFGSGSVPRACALGAAGSRLRGGRRPQLLRHLQGELHHDRPARRRARRGRRARAARQRPRTRPRSTSSAARSRCPSGREVAFAIDRDARERLLNGWDEIALTERRLDEIERYEAERERTGPNMLTL